MMGKTGSERKNNQSARYALAWDASPAAFRPVAINPTMFRMNDLERLRRLAGADANGWTMAQLEQLSRDIDQMAEILLDLYRSRHEEGQRRPCGSPDFDDPRTDR